MSRVAGVVMVYAYKTSDGQLWEQEDNANKHQRRTNFLNTFKSIDQPYAHGYVDEGDMLQWLLENRAVVSSLYGEWVDE